MQRGPGHTRDVPGQPQHRADSVERDGQESDAGQHAVALSVHADDQGHGCAMASSDNECGTQAGRPYEERKKHSDSQPY